MCGKGSQTGGGAGALGWGGLAPAQQQTVQASPQALGWYNQAMGLAQQAVSKPYQQFGTQASDFVAQLNAQQQAAQQGLAGQAAATQPYANQAAQIEAQAAAANPAQMAQQYMNPYMNQVVQPVQQALQQQFGQQLSQQQTDAINAGAFGGSRSDVARALLQGQQGLAMGQALSPLYQTGYGQALGAAQTQVGQQLAAGQNLAQQGLAAQQASLGAGTLGQQTQQAGISALQQQFNQQQMWPYMQAQFLSGIAGGLGPLTGQQTYQAQAMSPFGSFFADGGSVDGDTARMGGAVIDMEHGKDYYRGGVVPKGYATRGAVDYTPGDVGDILSSQESMYKDVPQQEQMPTGQIQGSQGLKSANLTQPQQKKTGLSDLLSAGKEAIGLGKDIYSAGKGAYDWLTSPSTASEVGGMGAAAEGAADTGILGGIGSAIADALPFLALKDGGRIGYDDGGVVPVDDTFDRGVIGAESAGRQFDRYGRTLTSPKGALGIAQIMPGTAPEAAKLAGLEYDPNRLRTDAEYNKALGKAYYNEQLRRFGKPELAAAAYNAGPGAVQNALRKAQATGRDVMSFLPAETQAYVPKVLGRGVTAPGGGLDQARAELMSSRRAIPPNDPRRSFLARDEESATRSTGAPEGGLRGLAREEYVVPALMGLGKGLSAMMSAKTVSPGAAIAAGLGSGLSTGAESYMGVQRQKADILKDTLGIMSERYTPMMGGGYWDKVTGRPVSAQERIAAVADMVPGLGGIVGGAAAPAAGGVPAAAGAPAAVPTEPGAAAVETAKALPKTEMPTAAKTPEEKAIEDVNRIPTVAEAMNKADQSQARVEQLLRLQSGEDPALAAQYEEKIKIAKDDAQRDRQNAIALQQTFLQSKLQEVRQRSEAELREEKEPGISAKKLTAEELGKNYTEDQAAARRADKAISNIKRARQLLQTGGFHTGYGGENILEGYKAASAVGIPGAQGPAAAADQFRAITTGMVVDLANGSLGGGVSNGDLKVLSSTKPGLTTERETNLKILDDMERLENRKKEIAVLENKWMAAHNGRLTPEFNAYLADWAEEHPLFSEEERRQAETGAASSSEAPLPMPKTADKLIVGRKYNTSQGVLTWNGAKFVKR